MPLDDSVELGGKGGDGALQGIGTKQFWTGLSRSLFLASRDLFLVTLTLFVTSRILLKKGYIREEGPLPTMSVVAVSRPRVTSRGEGLLEV